MGEMFQGTVKTDLVMLIVRVVILVDPLSWFFFFFQHSFFRLYIIQVLFVSIGEVLIDLMVKSHKMLISGYLKKFT